MSLHNKIAVIGVGYVGLPLAVEFGAHRPVIGFDIRRTRIEELRTGKDSTREGEAAEIARAAQLTLTDAPDDLRGCGIFIVTVPTPIDRANRPDFAPLLKATETVGTMMSKVALGSFN